MKLGNIARGDRLNGILFFLLGAAIFLASRTFPDLPEGHPGPGLFPSIIGILLALSGAGIYFSRSQVLIKGFADKRAEWLYITGILTMILVFPFVYQVGGFFAALFITLVAVTLIFKIIWWRALLIAVITCASIFVLFTKVLQVPI